MKAGKGVSPLLKVLAAALAAIVLSAAAFFAYNYVEIDAMSMKAKVGDRWGFNLDNRSLDFGTLPPGAGGERKINIVNNAPVPRLVTLYATGELNEWGDVSANNFVLSQNRNKTITVSVTVPANAAMKTFHEGTLYVVMRKTA